MPTLYILHNINTFMRLSLLIVVYRSLCWFLDFHFKLSAKEVFLDHIL